MKKEIYTCDECGAERKEANHWWGVYLDSVGQFVIRAFQSTEFGFHLCGQACVHAVLDRFMSTGKLEK